MRNFSGSEEFKKLSETVVGAYKALFPVEKNGHKLEAEKIWMDDADIDPQDYATQKKVKLSGGTFGVPLYASLTLKDQNGKVVDHIDKIRIASVPRITPRKSYIVGGNEYQVANQMIRKPGAYIVRSQKGDTFKGMLAIGGKNNKNIDIEFNPETNKYSAKIGTNTISLYSLAKSLGATDQELSHAWGEDIFKANMRDTEANYSKLADHLARVKTDNKQTAIEAIGQFAKTTNVDPKVTEMTLGKAHDGLSKGLILDTSKKLIQAYQGHVEPDDPENLLFKEIRSVEDMVHDKLTSEKEVEGLKRMLTRHLGRRDSIKKMIDFKKLTSPVESFFVMDNRTSTPEQYNPVHMLSEASKLTIHGTGGIESEHAVSANLREVHPSHVGFVDPVFTPESEKTGTTVHMAAGVEKNGREINAMVLNPKTGKVERLTPRELHSKTVAFPDEMVEGKFKNPSAVRVQRQGKVMTVPSSQVDAVLPTPVGMFSVATNLIPFLKNNQGARAAMASKMIGQALPLVHREAPLVQTEIAGGKTFHEAIGEEFSAHSPIDGKVMEVTKDYIRVGSEKIPLYNNFPLMAKTHIHHEPTVAVGDLVKKGQLLADSNFTKGGSLALGKNMTVAYLPIPGHTFEDGIVITESAAKKLSAEQTNKHSFQLEQGKRILDFKKWIAYYGSKLDKDTYRNLDKDGVIQKGTEVKPGSLLIAGLSSNAQSPENATLKKINKALMLPWADSSVSYTGEFPGVVTDVVKRADGVYVYVKSVEPARASDKLSGVHGNKGVISAVIPDHEAPRDANGNVPDVFINPHGIIGRINLGQMYESAAAKVAEKTGKPYVVKNFDEKNSLAQVTEALKKHGIKDTETLYDPSGKKLGEVNVGRPYILRLAKTGKSGFSARMPGSGYDNNLQPLKGGEEGTKSLDALMFYSMLSHGAKKNLVDAHQKSERNDEFWHAVETGKPIPAPHTTFAWEKFTNLIRGAGINVDKRGSNIFLAPMTDKDVLAMSRGKITEPKFLVAKNMKEVKGGFFDEAITGGVSGNNYSHIELPERLPNPIFEDAIKSISGLKKDQYEGLIAGRLFVTKTGQISDKNETGSITGGAAVAHILSKVDVNGMLAKDKASIKKMVLEEKTSDLDRVNRRIRYLSALKDLNLTPDEAYTRKTVAVIPPKYRPIQENEKRGFVVAPYNYLYQNLGLLSKAHEHPVMKLLDDSEKKELREETYKATRALTGLESVNTRGKDQPIEGFVSQIKGGSPKTGFFLSKLITKKQDLVGRGVITNGPDLHVDQLGIPEKMAWKIFRPFILRDFIQAGFKPEDARKEVDEQTDRAHKFLEAVMKKRTVLMNRAPSLHKFSVMAFKPILTDGLAIQVPPLVYKGFNADIDGDAVQIHVPVSDEAVRESVKMFPSNNLWKPGTGELMLVPSQEAAIGMYFLSNTEAGRAQLNKILPAKFHIASQLDAGKAKDLFNRIAKEDPQHFANIVHELKAIGDKHAYDIGFSATLKDLHVDTKVRDQVFAAVDKEAAKLKQTMKPGQELDNKISDLYEKAAKAAYEKSIKPQLKAEGSSFYHMIASGARGKDSQLQQLVSAPGTMTDAKNRKVPVPVKKSYAEGLTTSDYFISSYGARKGMIDRALQTSKPGALNKDILATTVDNVITMDDCGTHKGIVLPIDSRDTNDRFLSKDQGGYHRNDHVTPQMISEMKRRGVKNIEVRSPLKCLAPKGTCAHCYGHDEFGKKPEIGDNIGAKMGQAMSERVTQMTMQTFHTGGISGGSNVSGFERVNQLLTMPKYLPGEAAMAHVSGKVTQITKAPAGGHVIHIGDEKIISRPGQALKVSVGDSVKPGDLLSEGLIKPQMLAKHKGMAAAQDYLVDELQKTYAGQKVDMDRKVFETVVRSLANQTEVIEAPKHSEYLPGDLLPYTVAQHYNSTRKVTVNTEDSSGYHLAEKVGRLPEMHEIADKDIPYLKQMGYNEISVLKDPLMHKPVLKSIKELPFLRKDWLAQMGYQKIEKTLSQGAAQQWKSNVEGTNPVPAFAYGASFGKKKEHY